MNESVIISFIGGGNMASSLIGGLIANGHPHEMILVSEPNAEKAAALAARFQIQPVASNEEAVERAEVVVLAVKPQIMADVCRGLAQTVQSHKPLIISIAAGIPEQALYNWLGVETAVIRTMPNTPAMIQSGATALHAGSKVSQQQKNLAESVMRAVGVIQWVDRESDLDIVTALSGSGPAYFFLLMEILEQAAVDLGLPQETARLLTLQTALGAARMALESPDSSAHLRQQVTSPGGTTERAITTLEEGHIRQLFNSALISARDRSEELSNSFGG
jgi:pyrroline-5-carboxylate reductase